MISTIADYAGDPKHAKRAHRKVKKVAAKHAGGKGRSPRRGKRGRAGSLIGSMAGLGGLIKRGAEFLPPGIGGVQDIEEKLGGAIPGMHGMHMGGHRRRINPANVHALRRSLSRLKSFEKLAQRTLHLVRPGVRVKGFKMRGRKR